MDVSAQVREAARQRAAALVAGDPEGLRELLHPEFRWLSHAGDRFDRDSYVRSNTDGSTRWEGQELSGVEVIAHEHTAVLRCEVADTVDRGAGPEEFGLSMTQVWVRYAERWVCLAGHAGPAPD